MTILLHLQLLGEGKGALQMPVQAAAGHTRLPLQE